MNRNKYAWILLFLILGMGLPAHAQKTPPKTKVQLLPEGLEFSQVEGTARIHERTKAWRFATHTTLTYGKITIPTGTELTILPASSLEKIIAYAQKEDFVSLRIDALITQYRDTNFLYIFDAVPLKKIESTPPPEEPEPKPKDKINILRMATDPNETSVIPPDILQRMKPRKKTDFSRMEEAGKEIQLPGDTMIVNRTGRFGRRDTAKTFVLDGFGQNISQRYFTLLPCKTLEQAENRLGRAFSRQRYRVSGIVTTFRGKRFLLLQGATRTYTHGNFTP